MIFRVIDAQSRVGVFYQTVRNIQSVVSPFGLSFTPQGNLISLSGNVADSNEIGAELSLKGTLSQNWRWRLSYSPRLVRDKFKPGAAIFSTGSDYADMTSRHVVDATLGWSLGPWEVDGFLRFQSSGNGLFLSSRGYAVGSVGPVVVADARVGYRVAPGVTLSLSAQNVLFTTPQQTVFGKVEQQLLGSVSVRF